jgi:nucleoside-diphosphate-sugar epimerase
MTKKILIVGGAGYIGGFMVDLFQQDKNYDVTVLDNLLYEDRYLKKVNFINADIRDVNVLSKIVNNFDIIIWLAAIVGDGACAVNPSITEEANLTTVKWLVDNYKGKIVFTSTCSVYGVNNDLIDEEATPNPLSLYASTKLEAEKYIIENAKNYIIFRLGTLYGISDDHSRLRFDLVANILTLRAVRGEQLEVFGGSQWRPLLHVRDVSYATKYCLEHNITGLFNLSEKNVKITDLAEEIAKIIPNTKVKYTDMKFEDLRNYRVKNDKILATGWKPKENLHSGILEMKKIFKEGRVKNFDDPVYSNVAYLKHLKGEF